MAILTVSEQADMLKRLATNVMDHGTAQLYPAYAQAILDVLAALEVVTAERDEFSSLLAANVVVRAAQKLELDGVTAERDALQAKLNAIPWDAIRCTFSAADNDGYYNDDVAEWLMENGVQL